MPLKTLKLMLTVLLWSAVVGNCQADEFAGKQWPAAEQISIDQVSHDLWDKLLQKYVDDDGWVDYKSWHANAEDRQLLTQYLESLSQADPNAQADVKAQFAYWINAYNAVTVEGILRVYPTKSIRDHTPKLVGYNIWKDLYLYVGGAKINLDSIENKVLRKMGEPRIHFAIVCASISCPRLMNHAYTAADLETQLVTNTTDFFSRSRNLQIDPQASVLQLSSIIDWFGSDFGDTQQAQITAIAPYFPEQAKAFVARGGFSVKYIDYDWGLNAKK